MKSSFQRLLPSLTLVLSLSAALAAPAVRPNILWLVAEDINPHLGCYGDKFADTPNLDKLAGKGMTYLNAWCNAPVCAPARTGLISGVYPPSSGGEHMRSLAPAPAFMRMYPQYLREAGYYCINNAKTDYNLGELGKVWDANGKNAHYRGRQPGQPFFAAFNHEITHESQIRTRPHKWIHDPAKARVPAYHPDTLEVRQDWAQYYDNLTTMDGQIGKKLEELAAAGLADDTIVFFYGDNGSGMPRSKRWPYNSGLSVPLIIFIPEKWRSLAPKDYQPGGKTARLVSFVDFPPTLLSLAGIKPPEHLQGRAFMGQHEAPPHEYLHGFRGRMDERYDLVRSVRDPRYIYIRNYMPHKIYGQHIAYMFQTPTTRIWKQMFEEGKLNAAQARFWQPKPPEELYDLQQDPDEVVNLAGSPAHQEIRNRLRQAQREHALRIRDVGFLPEDEIHSRAKGSTPYEMGQDEAKYPLGRIMEAAELASMLKPDALPALKKAMQDPDSAARYWGALGILMRGQTAITAAKGELTKALTDAAPSVKIVAAEALGRFGNEEDFKQSLAVLLELAPQPKNGPYVSMQALNALQQFGPKAAPGLEIIRTSGAPDKTAAGRATEYSGRLVEQLVKSLQ